MKSALKQIVKLRGHHLVCLHFFKGEGYSLEYVENLREVLEKAEAGAVIKVSSGADDVCRMCPNLKGELCAYTEGAEAGIREMDGAALALIGTGSREEIFWSDVWEKLPDIIPQWSRKYCVGCGWGRICKKLEKFHRFANGRAD